jgi:EAL domain-containing protein (putative c-di-GMP-specific phosphodiesterase class I)
VALADGSVHHYEALIRPLPMPDCQVASTQDFVLLVETLGLAEELDLAVAEKTCAAAAKANVPAAFNVSGQSVQSPAFRNRLIKLLTGHPAHRSALVSVELTETVDIDEIDEAVLTAEALRRLGVAFCLDDFGAGAADVRLLHKLGPDIVKIDGSYVAAMAAGGRDRAFLAGMIDIARSARAAIVAERIETQAEADALRDMGVQYGQGWYFGRPGPMPVPAQPVHTARRRGTQESWG